MAEKPNREPGTWVWVIITRALGLVVGYIPFLPNTLFYLGLREDKMPIETEEGIFIVFGFLMVWGSKNFACWASAIGQKIINKKN